MQKLVQLSSCTLEACRMIRIREQERLFCVLKYIRGSVSDQLTARRSFMKPDLRFESVIFKASEK